MNAADFIRKWGDSTLRERQGSQEHFLDLCHLLGEPTPAEDDPHGERYCFDRGAEIVGGGDGWADVWRKGCFGWEYKGKHKDLGAALRQLQGYTLDLENPPYLVVSDMERIIVHTNWTNTVSRKYEFKLDDLREPSKLDLLRQVFQGSERLKPTVSPQDLTAKVAARFGELGRRLQERKHDPRAVAHFLNQLVFCMFAEDAELLPKNLFARMIRATETRPAAARAQLKDLFSKMATEAVDERYFGADLIRWFNGGLFDGADPLPLEPQDLQLIARTADEHDWSEIDPSIFGSLFEQALKATRERPALGAHYTDRDKILKIVEPVITRPLAAEWEMVRERMHEAMAKRTSAEAERRAVYEEAAKALKAGDAKSGEAARRKRMAAIEKRRDAALRAAKDHLEDYLQRLSDFRVLDPACGSGNFLYVALHALKDLELRARLDAERMGVPAPAPRVGLQCVQGIELERYAAELARVTLWIGDLQWMRKNMFQAFVEPILSNLDQIENRDALLNPDGTEAEWPKVDVIIGNPPFVGGKKQSGLIDGNDLGSLRRTYSESVPADANLVVYWFEKAFRQMSANKCDGFGFVSTQAIRRGRSNSVIRRHLTDYNIVNAWDNENWALAGAAVRVSFTCVMRHWPFDYSLNGAAVEKINADLTADIATNRPNKLNDSSNVAFQGTISGGPFEIKGNIARSFIAKPVNPNGKGNLDVIFPWRNGDDITERSADYWIIDFDEVMTESQAALFEAPFNCLRQAWDELILKCIKEGKPAPREGEPKKKSEWWKLQRRRSSSLAKTKNLNRYIATSRVAKFRTFVWLDKNVIPDTRLVAIPREDDTTFGILHSRLHEIWSLRFGGNHGVGNDPEYIHTQTFETFPFPEGLTPNILAADFAGDPRAQAIAEAARELNTLRENWLNPSDLVVRVPEVVPGYPDRILPKDEAAAVELKKRTLTNLYNQPPVWLANAHRKLDEAVAAAYGWPADLSDDEVLERLFALNQERAAAGR